MHQKIRKLTYTGLLLALLICLQWAGSQIPSPLIKQLITGTMVNCVLAVTVLMAGLGSGLTVALISPVCAFALGIAPNIVTVLPIMAGNDERAWRDLLFRYIYQFCEQHRRLASSRPDNIPILFTIMNGRIRELESQRATSTIEEKYRITARVGAISNILRIWMDDGMKESPEEIVNYIMGFITLI